MRIMIMITLILGVLFFVEDVSSFDHETTHRQITEKAVDKAVDTFSINTYLQRIAGLNEGVSSIIKGHTVTWWLSEGSYLEDVLNCRASNHFHNPLLSWDQSQMTDQPLWLDVACFDWKPWYSNVTWATGYLDPPPTGSKVPFSSYSSYSPITWDKANNLEVRL